METIPKKFRAYHKGRKEMYEVWSIAPDYVFKNTVDGIGCAGVPDKLEEVNIMQYLGKNDCKGNEFCEGDICAMDILTAKEGTTVEHEGETTFLVPAKKRLYDWGCKILGWSIYAYIQR